MRSGKIHRMLAASLIALSLTTTSVGGVYSTAVYAATPDNSQVDQGDAGDDNVSSNKAAIGLAALGLLAVLSGSHHDSKDKSTAVSSGSTSNSSSSSNSSSNSTTTTSSSSARAGSSADRQLALSLLNADRAKYKLSALSSDSALNSLAQKYAEDMINRHFFSHTDPDGLSPFQRMQKAGISYGYAGENLAENDNVTDAETAFMNSSGHRANILSTSYKKVGIGVAYDANGTAYVVQEFTD